jgi:phosphoribosyl-ATP pyrophosphohydrolase/phosphoribosyl-AMP cyclohydrolase
MSTVAPLPFDINQLDFEKGDGKVIVIAQDAVTGAVLMVAHADREAVARTIETAEMHYTSRTRGLWHKGATSGNVQRVLTLRMDCDRDALLARVIPSGPACHTGDTSCFSAMPDGDELTSLAKVLDARSSEITTKPGYTQRLLGDRNLRLKKLGEEAVELAVACVDEDVERVKEECADLLYHVLVAAKSAGVSLDDIRRELHRRSSG